MDGASGGCGRNGAAPVKESLRVTRIDRPGGQVLLRLAGEIDLASAPAFRAGLSAAIEDTRGCVLLDMGDVTFMDSAGIEELVRAREYADGRIRMRALHASVQRVLEMTALLEWFPFSDGADSDANDD